jgi:triosephosphate isomerase
MSAHKTLKALIGGIWKVNGTVSIKAMVVVLNKDEPVSANAEVIIASPSIRLQHLKSIIRPDISVAAQDICFKTS